MLALLRRNSLFLILWAAACLTLAVAILCMDKGSLHLALCNHHTPFLDAIIPPLTNTCHWLPYTIVLLLLLWRWQTGLFAGTALLLSTLCTQTLKHIVQAPRPLTWFAEHAPNVQLPLTEGVNMHYYLSFPSGHATTFFCIYFVLSIIFTQSSRYLLPPNGIWQRLLCQYPHSPIYTNRAPASADAHQCICSLCVQLLCFTLAAASTYTRLYLSQHFATDILAGMLIGVLSVLLVAFADFVITRAHKQHDNRSSKP